ncbi:hypothetical protein [uncultured Nocardioides sp.]|uniref:hypothetical protein n=1 Tax=uncultured Nocardioides sp. TaxID=198441 RepID=UPI00262CCDCE|nr:hypothetical protein [uncultured Nocardioides sp.]
MGLLWAAAAWLTIGPQFSASLRAADLLGRFSDLGLPVNVGWSAALLLTYLIGSLLVVRESPIEWLPYRNRLTWATHWTNVESWLSNMFLTLSEDGRVPVMRGFGTMTAQTKGFAGFYDRDTVKGDVWERLNSDFRKAVMDERPEVEVRIQMKFPDLYAELDRLRAEAEFRLSIFWPLCAMAVVLATQWSTVGLGLIALALVLWIDGSRRRREVESKLWAPVLSGDIQSPILEAMSAASDGPVGDFSDRTNRLASLSRSLNTV